MRYFSTRNRQIEVDSSQAIIQGISKDGGLFVPEAIPIIDNISQMKNMDYKSIAYHIMSKFITDLEPEALKRCISEAYDGKFISKEVAPVVEVDGIFFLELYHGPTLAFKDMALSILPYLLKESMRVQGITNDIIILTATSGDTGKAALEGFANVDNIKIIVFYPEKGVSEIQKRQMITQEGENTFVVGINGNFDDAQSGVKNIFNDVAFARLLEQDNFILSSANSINIGRLIPQIVYYFHSYLTLLRQDKIKENERINIVVPTGNFGNILAAFYSKKMGLPINKLICASNKNKVLTDFINTGIYDSRRDLELTLSPSMDILVSSNLERLLFLLSDGDANLIKDKMDQLSQEGHYNISNLDMNDFYGDYATEIETKEAIRKIFDKNNYLMDTHTAVAYNVYEKYVTETKDKSKTIIASTASPFKFGEAVAQAIGLDVDDKDEFTILEQLSQKTSVDIPEPIKDLKNKEVLHKNNCNKEDMKPIVGAFLRVGGSDDRS